MSEEQRLSADRSEAETGALVKRIESLHGVHTLEHAEEIGLGSRTYELLNIDE